MSNEEDWKEPYEENGITLGPEEILRREIEKSKNLKVERLKLKDEIDKLQAENVRLAQKIRRWMKKLKNPGPHPIKTPRPSNPNPFRPIPQGGPYFS